MRNILSLTLLCLLTVFVSYAQQKGHKPGELLVLLEGETPVDRVLYQLEKQTGVEVTADRRLSQFLNLWVFSFDAQALETEKYLEVVRGTRHVELCQLNHSNIEKRNTPDDPLLPLQWAYDLIDAKDAWRIATGGVTAAGDTIVVAVIDGGFDLDHEDLAANYFVNRQEIPDNGIDDDNNGYVDDYLGWNFYTNTNNVPLDNHGTHVAGTIGAIGNNATGVAGVNWNVKVMPLAGSSTQEDVVVESYAYAYDMRRRYNESAGAEGAYVVATNSSFGVNFGQPAQYPLWCAMYDSLGSVGVLSAGATINSNVNIDVEGDIPTACESDFLISVTNTTQTDDRNSGAGYGLTTIDLGAPGTQVRSTTNNDNYGNLSGTSMATPHVAGAIALMYSALCEKTLMAYQYDPQGLAAYMKDRLLTQGVDAIPGLQTEVVSGGRLNLLKSVRSVSDSCLNAYTVLTESNCGNCDGEASISVFGGFPPYSYNWSTGSSNDSSMNQLCAGIYTVTITDDISQTKVLTLGITDIGGPSLTVTTTDNLCPGESLGSAAVSGGFNHSWSTGQTGTSASFLAAGTYQVSATDEQGECTTVESFTINEPSSFFINFNLVFPVNGMDGSIDATVFGGTPPYNLLWSTGAQGSQIDQLDFGFYTLSVTDSLNCTYSQVAELTFPEGLRNNDEVFEVKVYPNPAKTTMTIELDNLLSWKLVLIDPVGRIVHQQPLSEQLNTVDISGYAAGTYTLTLSNANKTLQQKLIIMGQ